MKFKYFLFTAALLTGITLSAQKKEIKQAEDAIEKQDFAKAKELLNLSESDISSLNDKFKARYYTANGMVLAVLGGGNMEKVDEAVSSFEKAKKYGNEDEAQKGMHVIVEALSKAGVADQQQEDFKGASDKFHKIYEIFPTDTIYLFAAAANSFNAQDYETAIKHYKELRDIGYKGNDLKYTAVNKETEEVQFFENQVERDAFVKSGDYIDPQTVREDRKDGEVIKNLALAYLQIDEKDKASQTISEARKKAPNDPEVLKTEAMVYEQSGNTEAYLKSIKELIEKDSDNASFYNVILGDYMLMKKKDELEARKYYEKAIKQDGTSAAAYNGVANTYLNKQQELVEEMRDLGMSAADNKKYEELEKERNELLTSAIPYLEKALDNSDESFELMQTIYQIYTQLGNKDKAMEYREKMEAIQE